MAQVTFHALVHEEEDGSYWAEVKELPGCFASGFSIDELRDALFEAMQLWLPEGIKLDDPQWGPIKKTPEKAGKRKQQMLVCA